MANSCYSCVKELRPSAPEFVPRVLSEYIDQFNLSTKKNHYNAPFLANYFSATHSIGATKFNKLNFLPASNEFRRELMTQLNNSLLIIDCLTLEKETWNIDRKDLELRIEWLRNLIEKNKSEKETACKNLFDSLTSDLNKVTEKNRILMEENQSLRNREAIRCTETKYSENKTIIISKSITKHELVSNDLGTQCHNLNIKLEESTPKPPNKTIHTPKSNQPLEIAEMGSNICNLENEALDASLQSSKQSNTIGDTDANSFSTSIDVKDHNDLQCCCNKLRQHNECLKKIIRSQKERRLEREHKIKKLQVALEASTSKL